MKRARDILAVKGHDIWSIEPGASVYDAMKLMAEKEIGSLMVMEGAKLVGLISERDYARKVILHGRSSRTTQVREIMTTRVVYADPDTIQPWDFKPKVDPDKLNLNPIATQLAPLLGVTPK